MNLFAADAALNLCRWVELTDFSGLIYEPRGFFIQLIGWKNNKVDEYVVLEKHDQICTQQFN
jgi:hypothetical protein